tara:strand:- start:4988 stop:5440 length:453 start_codon:yes stop_codon:yes gene_type:complete
MPQVRGDDRRSHELAVQEPRADPPWVQASLLRGAKHVLELHEQVQPVPLRRPIVAANGELRRHVECLLPAHPAKLRVDKGNLLEKFKAHHPPPEVADGHAVPEMRCVGAEERGLQRNEPLRCEVVLLLRKTNVAERNVVDGSFWSSVSAV